MAGVLLGVHLRGHRVEPLVAAGPVGPVVAGGGEGEAA